MSSKFSSVISLEDFYKASNYFHESNNLTLRKNAPVNCFKDFDIIDNGGSEKCQEDVELSHESGFTSQSNLEREPIFDWCPNQISKNQRPEEVPGALVVLDKTLDIAYTIRGVEENEFPVIGTFVDERITPGFRYRVRNCCTGKDTFSDAKFLESIGIGYGKRITFRGDSLNVNENYFWSDTEPAGYAFAPETISKGDVFCFTTASGRESGLATVVMVAAGQREISSHVTGGMVVKKIKAHFTCSLKLDAKPLSYRHVSFVSNVNFEGIALVLKIKGSRTAIVKCVDCLRDGYNQKFTLSAV